MFCVIPKEFRTYTWLCLSSVINYGRVLSETLWVCGNLFLKNLFIWKKKKSFLMLWLWRESNDLF